MANGKKLLAISDRASARSESVLLAVGKVRTTGLSL